jgi:hypothetical protein
MILLVGKSKGNKQANKNVVKKTVHIPIGDIHHSINSIPYNDHNLNFVLLLNIH